VMARFNDRLQELGRKNGSPSTHGASSLCDVAWPVESEIPITREPLVFVLELFDGHFEAVNLEAQRQYSMCNMWRVGNVIAIKSAPRQSPSQALRVCVRRFGTLYVPYFCSGRS